MIAVPVEVAQKIVLELFSGMDRNAVQLTSNGYAWTFGIVGSVVRIDCDQALFIPEGSHRNGDSNEGEVNG